MRPHPVRLLVAALVVSAACWPVPPARAASAVEFAAAATIDPVLRYPMTIPVSGTVESLFGGGCPSRRSHVGVDLSSPEGAPTEVHATYPGFASSTRTGNGYGLTVEIVHVGDGVRYSSRYAHLSATHVPEEGRWVRQGDVVGMTGATGNAQSVHLHFEIRDGADVPIDLNPGLRPCRREVVAGAPLAVDLPGLVSPAFLAVSAIEPNTWAITSAPSDG